MKLLKTHKMNILSLITTFFVGFIIISVGYRVLDIIGDYFIITDSSITPHTSSENSSYIFYTQSEADITLFPWNYYDESNPSYYEYLMNYGQLYTEDFYLGDYIDTDEFYERIRYSFYQTVPGLKKYIIAAETSLYDIMDFDNIAFDLSVSNEITGLYLFYDKKIYIEKEEGDGSYYQITFSLTPQLELLSFSCRPVRSDLEYTPTVMELGKSQLTNMINYNNGDSLSLLIYDMTTHENILENYELSRTSQNNYVLNISDEDYAYFYYSDDYEEYFEKYDKEAEGYATIDIYDDYDDSDNVEDENYDEKDFDIYSSTTAINELTKNSQSQSQIVETDNEILVIVTEFNIVLHYEPIDKVFTGFNLISK